MNESNIMQEWVALAGSLGTILLLLTVFGLMLGIMNRADALRRIGAILGATIVLIVAPCILVNAWLGITLWEMIGLVAIGVVAWQWRRHRRQAR